jgi:hypothetical protein
VADILDVTPDPRTTAVSALTITFNEAVVGLDLADLKLSRDGGSNLLSSAQTLTTSNNMTWTLGNLSGLTSSLGNYTLTLTAAGSGISDTAGNVLTADSSDAWQVIAPPVQIIDDGAAGFSTVGTWKIKTGQGFDGDLRFVAAGTGSKTATWTFTSLIPGQYRVAATWSKAGNQATNAPFTVLDGGTALGTVAVNEKNPPGDFLDAGAMWKTLGAYQLSGTTLVVRLTDSANGVVVADAVRIELIAASQGAAASGSGTSSMLLAASIASPSSEAQLITISTGEEVIVAPKSTQPFSVAVPAVQAGGLSVADQATALRSSLLPADKPIDATLLGNLIDAALSLHEDLV